MTRSSAAGELIMNSKVRHLGDGALDPERNAYRLYVTAD
jgi:hypothetical protein